jgi:hypothetical protein
MTLDPAIFDDLFHSCSLAAFVEVATTSGKPPDIEATKRLAFRLYEEALAAKNAARKSLYSVGEAVTPCVCGA